MDKTIIIKFTSTFIASLLHAYLGLFMLGLYYGREVGQEQEKYHKKYGTPIVAQSIRGFFWFNWGRSNQFDYYGALSGFVVGYLVRGLI